MALDTATILTRFANALQKTLADYGEYEGPLTEYRELIDDFIACLFEEGIILKFTQDLSYNGTKREIRWNFHITPSSRCILSPEETLRGISYALKALRDEAGEFCKEDKQAFFGPMVTAINTAAIGITIAVCTVTSDIEEDKTYALKIGKIKLPTSASKVQKKQPSSVPRPITIHTPVNRLNEQIDGQQNLITRSKSTTAVTHKRQKITEFCDF